MGGLQDDLSIKDKVDLDVEYLKSQSFWLDMKILFITFIITLKRSGISH
jgi:O-antigen biosynthesis protein WbqP